MLPIADKQVYWSWKNILFFLLIFSIPFSWEYHVTSSLGTDLPDEPLMLLVAFCFLAAWVYRPGLVPNAVLLHPLLLILFFLLGWTIISLLFSTHFLISVKYLLAKLWYMAAFLLAGTIVFADRKNIRITGTLLLVSMFLAVLIVMIRHSMMGFQFATINKALFPFFRNHVNYSAMLVCMLPVTVAAFVLSSGKLRWLLALVMVIFLVALFFSYSRGAWLALPVGLLAAWLASKRKLFVAYLICIVLVAGSIFWLSSNDRYLRFAPEYRSTIFHEDFREHWIATYQLKDVSTAERFYRWVAGARMVKDKWLLGFGPNCFYEEYKPYAVPAFKTWVSKNPDHSTVHNYFLLTAIEQGIPGLILLLCLFGAMIWFAEKNYQRSNDNEFERVIALMTASVISMLLLLNFLSDLVETDKLGSLFFLCMALIARKTIQDPSSNNRVK